MMSEPKTPYQKAEALTLKNMTVGKPRPEPDIAEVVSELADLHELLSELEELPAPMRAYADDVQDAITLLRKLERMEHVATVIKEMDYGVMGNKVNTRINEALPTGTKLYALKESSDD